MALKERYGKLKDKYSLPEYINLNRDFDIEELHEDSEILLQKIRIRMFEKMDYFAHLLSFSIQPDTDLSDMYESKYIDDDTREAAFVVYKNIQRLLRLSSLVAVENNDEENAKFIKEAYAAWQKLKPQLKEHLKKLVDTWDIERDVKTELSYFG
ncbi:MAG: hypothetical protein NDI94_06780 [Candidatus Woesearchaeota archaeon]|nr:hypothetical protein [Candidatus Woesearchaeota archaeon]